MSVSEERDFSSIIDLNDFPEKLRNLDDFEPDPQNYKNISRDKLTKMERVELTEFFNYIYEIMDNEQKQAFNEMLSQTNDTNYTQFDSNIINNIKMPITLLNAGGGTGKTMIILAYQIAVNLDFGYKNGAIVYTPSYASLQAVEYKITDLLYEKYGLNELVDIEKKSKCIRECLSINIINSFYACGSDSFNIHDKSVSGKVIQKFRKARITNVTDLYKINNVQAIRESRAIICDEAFFSTSNRCDGFIDMLMDGYIDHPYLNNEIRSEFPRLLDRLVYLKKIVFSGDPYQLSVSVEQKDPGVENYRIEEGDPLWYYKNKLRDSIRLIENIDDPTIYHKLTLTQNYRFTEVPEDLKNLIENMRYVIYKNELDHDQYKLSIKQLILCMEKYNMIKYNQNPETVASYIENEDRHKLYVVSEVHAASKLINKQLDTNKYRKKHIKYIDVKTYFVYGNRQNERMEWLPYNEVKAEKEMKAMKKGTFTDFKERYINECKNGVVVNKFIGPTHPDELTSDYISPKLFIGDKVRFTYPLSNIHGIKRVLNNTIEEIPDDMKITTGTFGEVVNFEGDDVFVEICNDEDAERYNKKLTEGKQTVKLDTGYQTDKPIFIIKHSMYLERGPFFKSAFCDYIIPEKSFNLGVQSYPFTKESASTIHSLQGKTISKKEKIVYYMHSFKKIDLEGVICNEVGQWKGCLPNLFYVAITRSRVPHTNFILMTGMKNSTELIKNITSGKRPRSYNQLKEFNEKFTF